MLIQQRYKETMERPAVNSWTIENFNLFFYMYDAIDKNCFDVVKYSKIIQVR
jgi:hypothetical protein